MCVYIYIHIYMYIYVCIYIYIYIYIINKVGRFDSENPKYFSRDLCERYVFCKIDFNKD